MVRLGDLVVPLDLGECFNLIADDPEDLDADCDGAVSLEDYVAWVTQGTVPRDANSSIVASTPMPAGPESMGSTDAGHTQDDPTAADSSSHGLTEQ